MRENPFRYGPAALGPNFTDRTKEVETLVRDLRSRQNVVVISPRRFGKTSLALTARDRLVQDKVLVAYADLFRATTKHRLLEEFGTALYRGLSSGFDHARAGALELFHALPLSPKLTLGKDGSPAIEFGPLAVQEDQDRALQHLLDLPEQFGRERGRQVVVILDEFQEIVTLDPTLPAMLRGTMQLQEHVAYAFLGSRKHLMTRVFSDRNEPLYRSARALQLGPIPPADFAPFIRRTFESTEVWIDDEAIGRILAITDGHPHDTQELAHFAWEHGAERSKVVTTGDVEAALMDVVEAEDAHYTTLWESLSRAQRPVVQALSAEPTTTPYAEAFRSRHQLGSAATVQRALQALMEREVVDGSSIHGYRVPDVFLRTWITVTLGSGRATRTSGQATETVTSQDIDAVP
jgi:AAA+ ATPase superfamily predicted ATPase